MIALNEKTVKMIAVILASLSLATKFGTANSRLMTKDRHFLIAFVAYVTYFGYCYLIAIVAVWSLNRYEFREDLRRYYCVLGAILYVTSELLLWDGYWYFTTILGMFFSLSLAVLFIYEAFAGRMSS